MRNVGQPASNPTNYLSNPFNNFPNPHADQAAVPTVKHSVTFPGIDGIPFRGAGTPLLKKHEVDKLVKVRDGKARVFNLGLPGDLQEYNRVWDCVVKGLYQGYAEERQWSEKEQVFFIFLRWAELYTEIPGAIHERRKVTESGQVSFSPT